MYKKRREAQLRRQVKQRDKEASLVEAPLIRKGSAPPSTKKVVILHK